MIRTTSLKHYKELKSKGINCELTTKQELNTRKFMNAFDKSNSDYNKKMFSNTNYK